MRLKIKYFASIREWTGLKDEIMDVKQNISAEELRNLIVRRHNKLEIEGNILVAVNGSFVDTKYLIKESDEVALFPPVSGG